VDAMGLEGFGMPECKQKIKKKNQFTLLAETVNCS
jgi:hypothetical protein